MTSWKDKAGRVLAVMPADGLNPARLVIGQAGTEPLDCARFWLDGEADLAEVAVALFAANGQPAPVMLGRPVIMSSVPAEVGPFRVRLCCDGVCVEAIRVAGPALEPVEARRLAALICAYADAAEAEPDPAEAGRLAELIEKADPDEQLSGSGAREIAVALLRAGVTLPGGDGQ